jgi:hypothetical protein
MDQAQELASHAYRAALFASRQVGSLVQQGQYGVLLASVLALYAAFLFATRLARSALWLAKMSTIFFAVLAAVGYADSGWRGAPPAGMRGLDYWSQQGAKNVASAAGFPGVLDGFLGGGGSGSGSGQQPRTGARTSTPTGDSPWNWANMARSAGQAYAGHGAGTLYNLVNEGISKLTEATAQDSSTAAKAKAQAKKRKTTR